MSMDTERFWAKVDKAEDCWLWAAALDDKGYGRFSMGASHAPDGHRRNSMVAAHRYSWIIANGPIPSGQWVLHKCDTPPCVNPSHLFLGDNTANVRDMHAKGRNTKERPEMRGERHHQAKLTLADVEEIISLRQQGWILRTIAERYGVCASNICHITTGRNWKWRNIA